MNRAKTLAALFIALLTFGCIAVPSEKEGGVGKTPERIVSTAPSNTEILYALGLGDEVVGVTEYCNYPAEAKLKEKIGGFSTVNLEKVVALNPDLVLASGGVQEQTANKLKELGLNVVLLDPKSVEDIIEDIRLVGSITGREEVARELADNLEQRVKAVTDRTEMLPDDQKPRVLYVLWHDPLMSAGSATFADDLIRKAGGVNIANFSGYKAISLESAIEQNPQVIICSVGMSPTTLEWVRNESKLKVTDALKNGRVYAIDSDIVSRAGPRIVEALEQIASYIHPELF